MFVDTLLNNKKIKLIDGVGSSCALRPTTAIGHSF
jgi:hypothetical protein